MTEPLIRHAVGRCSPYISYPQGFKISKLLLEEGTYEEEPFLKISRHITVAQCFPSTV